MSVEWKKSSERGTAGAVLKIVTTAVNKHDSSQSSILRSESAEIRYLQFVFITDQ